MNIYNKLFILAYTNPPIQNITVLNIFDMRIKIWHLNLSKNFCNIKSRDFDLVGIINETETTKFWYRHNKLHRLIGPSTINVRKKLYYINGNQNESV